MVMIKKRGGEASILLNKTAKTTKHDRLKASLATTAIEVVPIASLKPNPRNTRIHPPKQLELLAKNIAQFGLNSVIVVDDDDVIICGHGRMEALKLLGEDRVPIRRIPRLATHEKSAQAISDNKLPELATTNTDLLTEDLAVLFDPELDLDFDPASILGFEMVEVDQLLDASPSTEKTDPADDFESQVSAEPPVTHQGDVWCCGVHRLAQGNALGNEAYAALMGDELAQVVFTDPPYNVPNKGHVTRRPGVREFAEANGDKDPAEFIEYLKTGCVQIQRRSIDGAVIFICIDWRHLAELTAAAEPVFGRPKNVIVWDKGTAGMGSFYRSQHEFIPVFVNGKTAPINNFGLGGKGRYRTNVWKYPGFNSFGRHRDAALAMHPTVKPVALVADALLDCSRRRDLVLDPFGGSGTTMIAAERTGRIARLIELDPYYCDVIVRRWQEFTSQAATLASSGQTFDEVANSRSSGGDTDVQKSQ